MSSSEGQKGDGLDERQEDEEVKSFLAAIQCPSQRRSRATDASRKLRRPFVTLTFAQTIDGCIAGENGQQLILSGNESMAMTHRLRTLHDAILVGVGTVINDNPRLNARLVLNPPGPSQQPLPIILDSSLRTPQDCKLIVNARSGEGRRPVTIIHTGAAKDKEISKWSTLQQEGVVRLVSSRSTSWIHILDSLAELQEVGSIMVEGGARVIESLFTATEEADDYSASATAGQLIDALVITVSPKFAGPQATRYRAPTFGTKPTSQRSELSVVAKRWFGDDAVWIWKRAGQIITPS